MLHRHETRHFPDGFLWGVATSSFQVEGGNDNTDWWEWQKIPGKIQDGSRCLEAVDEYHRYEEDFDLCAAMNNNAHRLSIEWARLEPKEGEWSAEATEHYRKVLEAVRRRGMKVMLTLWHFTLPKWFIDKGGWEHPLAVRRYLRLVRYAAENFGDLVDFWNTENEPNVYVTQSYLSGAWPPGVKNVVRTLVVGWRLVMAHRAAYKLLHRLLDKESEGRRCQVGVAQNVLSIEAYRMHSTIDYFGTRIIDWFWNHSFLSFSRREQDFLGLNYYFHHRLKKFGWPPIAFFTEVRRERRDVSDVGWEVNPGGIFKVLQDFASYKLPIYITENGIPSTNDDRRKRFIVGYLKELYHAINSGVDVRGYFFWSLVDNFEWEKGYAARFGLVEVDLKTQKRIPRGSYSVYAAICKENGLPHEMLRYIGHAVDQPYEPLPTGVHAVKNDGG